MREDADAQALCSLVDEQQNSLYLQMQVSRFSLTVGPEVTKLVERLLDKVRVDRIKASRGECWTSVLAYGSSGLHASIEGSDVDLYVEIALCSPKFTESHFFEGLPPLLKESTTELNVVRTARVPIIKFVYRGIRVDLIYASTDLTAAPSLADVEKDEFLLHVSRDNRINVNGVRTVLQIERLVGVPLEQYRCVLRAVKRWAVRRGIYHNKFAYPNGVVLAILVARTCQVGTGLQTSQLLKLFFLRLAQSMTQMSSCSGMAPVFITASVDRAGRPEIDGMPTCWDAVHRAASDELFPVINPAYPYVNSGHAVGRCAFVHVAAETQRAARLLHSSSPFGDALAQVWQPYALTSDYDVFAVVDVTCVAREQASCRHLFDIWRGFVESRFRMLLYALECFVDMRPYPAMLAISEHQDGVTRQWKKSGGYYIGVRPRTSTVRGRLTADQLRLVNQQVQHCVSEFLVSLEDNAVAQSFERQAAHMLDPVCTLRQWPRDSLPDELLR